jgi:FkbM family methyltransferase
MNNKRNELYNYINKITRNISVLDVGARGGIGWPWTDFDMKFVNSILIEPDPIEAKNIQDNLSKSTNTVVLPVAFWNNISSVPINLNKSPGTSSVFSPNLSLLNQFPDSDRFHADKIIKVDCTTIDYLIDNKQMPKFDFAKIDIQGGELAVLEGGLNYIKSNVIGLELEVEFVQLYENQPLFAEIDIFVRNSLGLELWDLSKAHWRYLNGTSSAPKKGRLIFGNALYLRPLQGLNKWLKEFPDDQACEKLLMLISTSLAYGFLDYASAILNDTSISKYIKDEERKEIIKKINDYGKGFSLLKNGNSFLFKIFHTLATFFKPSKNGRLSEGILGSKKNGPFWI